jgi:hypothetical protein
VIVGDKVRVIGIPDGLEDYPDFPTKSTFEWCIGREFTVRALMGNGTVEIYIGSVTGNEAERIYIAPEFLELNSK